MINVVVVDDDKSDMESTVECLKRYSAEHNVEINITCFKNSLDFIEKYKAGYDIIFMDIEMPSYDGISAMKRIRRVDENTILIFITNMSNMAINCYEVGASDFVVKPIEYFSFEVKMDRAIKRLNDKKQVELLIKTSDGVIKLTAAQLIYVEVVKHNVIYHTRDREYVSYSSLKEVEIMLQENGFSRCNNCYLVNLMHITHIDENNLYLDELSSPLAISRTRRKALIEDWTECVKRNNR